MPQIVITSEDGNILCLTLPSLPTITISSTTLHHLYTCMELISSHNSEQSIVAPDVVVCTGDIAECAAQKIRPFDAVFLQSKHAKDSPVDAVGTPQMILGLRARILLRWVGSR